jgi:hypothetical protein
MKKVGIEQRYRHQHAQSGAERQHDVGGGRAGTHQRGNRKSRHRIARPRHGSHGAHDHAGNQPEAGQHGNGAADEPHGKQAIAATHDRQRDQRGGGERQHGRIARARQTAARRDDGAEQAGGRNIARPCQRP